MASTFVFVVDILIEIGRYIAGSRRSRLRQLADLRDLDDRLLRDIGITRREAERGRRLRHDTSTRSTGAQSDPP